MSNASIPVVRLSGVRKHFPGTAAIDNLDLAIERGTFFTLLGPSGSGKTTTLRLIAGFEQPDAGRVELDGRDVAGLPPYKRDVNTVFQDYALFPHMTVLANVAYGLLAKRVRHDEAETRAREALRLVQLLPMAERRPGQLSGGQRQRVALARALVNRPRLLLLDEPLGALDLKLRHEMQVELKRLQQELGITFLYVTHDQEEALTMSDRIAVFNRGRIEQVGTPADLYERPATEFVASFVGVSNLLRRDGKRLVLRPEKIALRDTPPGAGESGGHGRIVQASYLGMVTRYSVALADGARLIVVEQNREGGPRLAEGAPVYAVWRDNAVHELAGAAGPASAHTPITGSQETENA